MTTIPPVSRYFGEKEDFSCIHGVPFDSECGECIEDKKIVERARKIRNFLSQPFHVATHFNGTEGIYVKREDTVRSFKEILEGKADDLPEIAFLYVGTIEEVRKKAKSLE